MDVRADQTRASSSRKHVAFGLLAFLATPFAVTGIYRVLPESTPFWLWSPFPFAVLGLVALALFMVPAVFRSVGVGIALGLVVWAIFLIWLIAAWSGPRI